MSGRFDWWKCGKDVKPKTNVIDEEDYLKNDRAARWLAMVAERRREQEQARKAQLKKNRVALAKRRRRKKKR